MFKGSDSRFYERYSNYWKILRRDEEVERGDNEVEIVYPDVYYDYTTMGDIIIPNVEASIRRKSNVITLTTPNSQEMGINEEELWSLISEYNNKCALFVRSIRNNENSPCVQNYKRFLIMDEFRKSGNYEIGMEDIIDDYLDSKTMDYTILPPGALRFFSESLGDISENIFSSSIKGLVTDPAHLARLIYENIKADDPDYTKVIYGQKYFAIPPKYIELLSDELSSLIPEKRFPKDTKGEKEYLYAQKVLKSIKDLVPYYPTQEERKYNQIFNPWAFDRKNIYHLRGLAMTSNDKSLSPIQLAIEIPRELDAQKKYLLSIGLHYLFYNHHQD